MKIEFQILCPNKKCKKCKKMIAVVNQFITENNIDADIIFINKLDEMLNFETWILPSLFVEYQYITRGYIPTKNELKIRFNKIFDR